jgi:hypothetical protein
MLVRRWLTNTIQQHYQQRKENKMGDLELRPANRGDLQVAIPNLPFNRIQFAAML